MSGEDLTASRVRRMLPSVSEVLKELTARASIEPDVAFRAARDVCAEELKRIRDVGGESVPLEVLVERALARLPGGRAPAGWPAPPPLPPPIQPFRPAPEPSEPAGIGAVEDPFSETTGALDLRWDRDAREPFSEAQAAGPLAEEAVPPPTVELPGIPEPEEPVPAPVSPVDEPPGAPAGDGYVLAIPEDEASPVPPSTGLEEEFGDETLTRLSREAEAMDLRSVFPPGAPTASAPPAFATRAAGAAPEDAAGEAVPPPFEDDEDTVLTIPRGGRRGAGSDEGPRWGLVAGVAAGLVALAGLGYLLVGLWVERDAEPVPVAVTRPKTPAPATPLPTAATEVPAAPAAPGPSAVSSPAAAAPAPTSPAPAAVASAAATPPAPVAAAPAVRPVPTAVPAPAPPPATVAVPVRQSRDGLVVTRDRAGLPEVFSIHFTSYRDRAAAERDLKRIASLIGRDGFVAEVDLGEKGVWQRVMIGAFPSAAEAKEVRAELAAKGTRDLGWVYRVVGP